MSEDNIKAVKFQGGLFNPKTNSYDYKDLGVIEQQIIQAQPYTTSNQLERRELFKQVAVLRFDKLSFEWEGSQSVGLSHQCYKFIATCAEAILKAADEFSKKDGEG